jgi:hypothetical protein
MAFSFTEKFEVIEALFMQIGFYFALLNDKRIGS